MLISLPPYRQSILNEVIENSTSDPLYRYVKALLHMDGNGGEGVLTDVKGHTFNRNGSGSSLSTAVKKFGSTALLCTRGGSTCTFSSTSTDYVIGTQDFTVECWAWFASGSAGGNGRGLFQFSASSSAGAGATGLNESTSNSIAAGTNASNGKFEMYAANGSVLGSTDIVLNTWTHVAISRSGGITRLFLNGVVVATVNDTVNYTGGNLCIGSYWSTVHGFDGYIDEFRLTIGASRYSANFVPPAQAGFDREEPLWSQVRALFHMDTNPPVDAKAGVVSAPSGKSFSMSTTQKKFGTSALDLTLNTSAYPQVADSALPVFGTQDFCIEMWVYHTAGDGNLYHTMFTNYTSWNGGAAIYWGRHGSYSGRVCALFNFSGGPTIVEPTDPPLNQWSHYALVRKGTEIAIYRNGVKTASGAVAVSQAIPPASFTTTPYAFGSLDSYTRVQGYIDECRISCGTAVYYNDFTVPTGPFANPTDPYASQVLTLFRADKGLVDQIGRSTFDTKTVPLTAKYTKFGGPTAEFDGTTNTRLASSTGSGGQVTDTGWTIEAWIYIDPTGTGNRTIVSNQTGSAAGQFSMMVDGNNKLILVTNIVRATSTAALPTGQWVHVAIDKNASTYCTLWINGVGEQLAGNFGGAFNTAVGLGIGGRLGGDSPFKGAIDSVRITNALRYTASFTPVQFQQ